jgi:ribosomal protein S1/HrpA-like RNA helicase
VGDVTGTFDRDPEAPERKRGLSASYMRAFMCKDCQRDVERLEAQIAELERGGGGKQGLRRLRTELEARRETATYNENWARNLVERGGSRSDRCKDHRQKHKIHIQGLAVAYIDLQTLGEVADRENPTGPLGGLGPLPVAHKIVPDTSYDLQDVRVGMTDDHVTEMIALLRQKQVLILKAGTGTGKSTFAPYRLMDPPLESLHDIPPGSPFGKLTELGPIVVTEPRVQAAVGVASFVGGVMSGAGGVGPGYPVGYQVSGDRNHDEACELIYVTDGTMINWLREGRLSRIGTVIVDEAHERSTNIDFIMGYLKRELPRNPHLRVIITSATFNTDFYLEYFGGDSVANLLEVPPEKTFGYGMPLFPNLDASEEGENDVLDRWTDTSLPLSAQNPRDEWQFIQAHWKVQHAEPLTYPDDVRDDSDDGFTEDVWDTTRRIMHLRYDGKVPSEQWQARMPGELAKFVINLAKGLDDEGIFGDILGFLPTRRTIEPVCEEIERALGRAYKDQVFPLISSLPKDRQRKALAKRRRGDPRKIVISTNLAETSLTVEGVRFVVDSGIIAQSEWDPELAKGGIPTKPHSQAGIKQRWGRVGRKAPGWVFPLYTKGQYLELAEDTPPGSTRENLEALVMTAKMGGIDDVRGFDWPAAFQPATVELDESAAEARKIFIRELERADRALQAGGAVDDEGHPTSFGKELMRFQGLGSTASALAILYADRLACVPEVATIIALLEDKRLIGQRALLLDDFEWPDEWRLEAAERHRGLATLCEDEAELVLLLSAAWEHADPKAAPWEDSAVRRRWARQWWVSHSELLEAAQKRHEVLSALSPAMKEDVKRFIEPALINRARGVLTRALAAHTYLKIDGQYHAVHTLPTPDPAQPAASSAHEAIAPDGLAEAAAFGLEDDALIVPSASRVIALRRRESRNDKRISSLVIAQLWAMPATPDGAQTTSADAMRMVVASAHAAPPDTAKTSALRYLESWPVGQRVRAKLRTGGDGQVRMEEVQEAITPFPRPESREERGTGVPARGQKPLTRRKLQFDEDDLSGTTDDSSGELPQPARRGYDDEAADQAAFQAADLAAESSGACGQCFPCLDGRPEDCDNPVAEVSEGKREDPVVSWRRAAQAGKDISTPAVQVEGENFDSSGWFEVTGYHREADIYVVRLRPDWRRGQPGSAGQHPGLKAGDPIEVRVGRRLRHHGGDLQAFERADGKGRFILAEASNHRADVQERRREIAVSLDRGNTELLAELTEGAIVTATVVPARAEGTVTITLLELLHQHWAKSQDGRGTEYHVLDKTRRNATARRVYAAVVEKPPNENGYVTARLLHQDGSLGIIHRFDFNIAPKTAGRSDASAPDDGGVYGPGTALSVGDPVLLNLVSDRASLDVSGLDVKSLREIEKASARQLEIVGLAEDEDQRGSHPGQRRSSKNGELKEPKTAPEPSADEDPDQDNLHKALPGTVIKAQTDKPLPRSAAIQLTELNDEPEWPNQVWAFWARTHHLKVSDRPAFIPGTRTEPFDVPATVTVNTQHPIDQQRELTSRFAEEHPVYSTVECFVRALSSRGAYVHLGSDLEGFVPLAELSWANRVTHPNQVVSAGQRVRALIITIPEPPEKPQLSIRALTPDPFTAFQQQHTIGDRISGTVVKLTPAQAFLELPGDVDGAIHISNLDHVHVDSPESVLSEGDAVESVIISFDTERRRVELSRKAVLPKPYEIYTHRHRVGDRVHGTVSRTSKSHVYLTLPYGATGVIHIGNLAHDRIDDPSDAVSLGDEVEAKIIKFDNGRQQIELSRKELLPNPYLEYKARHAVGEIVQAQATRTTRTHVYVRLPNGALGSIHVGQIAYERVEDPSLYCPIGSEVTAQITNFDDQRSQVELSIKALLPKPYVRFRQTHAVGQAVVGVVTNTIPALAFVDLGGGVQGSIHVSQLASYRVAHPDDVVKKGQQVTAVITAFDDARERIQLSLKPTSPAYSHPYI